MTTSLTYIFGSPLASKCVNVHVLSLLLECFFTLYIVACVVFHDNPGDALTIYYK